MEELKKEEVVEEAVNEVEITELSLRDKIIDELKKNNSEVVISQLLSKVCKLFETNIVEQNRTLVSPNSLLEKVEVLNIGKIGPIEKITMIVVFKNNELTLTLDSTSNVQNMTMNVDFHILNDHGTLVREYIPFIMELDKMINRNSNKKIVTFIYNDKEYFFDDKSTLFGILHDSVVTEVFVKKYQSEVYLKEYSLGKNMDKEYLIMNSPGNILLDQTEDIPTYTIEVPNFFEENGEDTVQFDVNIMFETEDMYYPLSKETAPLTRSIPHFNFMKKGTREIACSFKSNIILLQKM